MDELGLTLLSSIRGLGAKLGVGLVCRARRWTEGVRGHGSLNGSKVRCEQRKAKSPHGELVSRAVGQVPAIGSLSIHRL